jgi:release factor glutamine methyltransferase
MAVMGIVTGEPDAWVVTRLRQAGCVFAEDEARLLIAAAPTDAALAASVERRASGLPLEHILGWAEFCGLRIEVDQGIFVPRRRTAFLVELATAVTVPGMVVIDMCCGSGAVGAALHAAVHPIELHAVDIDPAAVRCASRNVPSAVGQVHVGDLYDPLPRSLRGRVDVITANAPYVPSHAVALMPPEARLHEPRVALDGGEDGLDVQRRVIAEAPQWLKSGGALLIETSTEQAPLTMVAAEGSGLLARLETSPEVSGTVVVARLP